MARRIYISGPMSGKHLWNWPAFERAEEWLQERGWDVVSPARVDEEEGLVTVTRRKASYGLGDVVTAVELSYGFDFREAIERDLELVEGCDAIYLLRGWEDSLGAGIELDRALRLGLEVLVEHGALRPAHLRSEPQDVSDAFATDRDEAHGPRPFDPPPLSHFTYLGDDDPGTGEEAAAWADWYAKWQSRASSGTPLDHFTYLGDDDPPSAVITEDMLRKVYVDEGWGAERSGPVYVTEGAATWRPLPGGEVRVTDPETGGQKGSKLARYDLIPHEALEALAEHFGRGAAKYEDRNWERGYDWALTFAALNRHLWAWWGGEDVDPETGSNHMTAVAWHAFVALTFQERGLGTDTRVVPA